MALFSGGGVVWLASDPCRIGGVGGGTQRRIERTFFPADLDGVCSICAVQRRWHNKAEFMVLGRVGAFYVGIDEQVDGGDVALHFTLAGLVAVGAVRRGRDAGDPARCRKDPVYSAERYYVCRYISDPKTGGSGGKINGLQHAGPGGKRGGVVSSLFRENHFSHPFGHSLSVCIPMARLDDYIGDYFFGRDERRGSVDGPTVSLHFDRLVLVCRDVGARDWLGTSRVSINGRSLQLFAINWDSGFVGLGRSDRDGGLDSTSSDPGDNGRRGYAGFNRT